MGCLMLFGLVMLAGSLSIGWDGLPGILCALMILWTAWDMRPDQSYGTYKKPVVTGARIVNGVGELDVESSHSEHVVRAMNFIPPSSTITIVERNQKYKVTFDTPCKQTPDQWETTVYSPGGTPHREVITYSQQDADRNYVRDVARANGYEGKIEG